MKYQGKAGIGTKEGINYDNDATNDVFCIDGQRLIPIPGSGSINSTLSGSVEYRTEIDRFDRIEGFFDHTTGNTIVRGIANFRVAAKNGLIMHYGSRWWQLNEGIAQNAIDPNRFNTVRTWPLDKVVDRNGNFYTVDYDGLRSNFSAPVAGTTAANSILPVGSFPASEFYPVQMTYTHTANANAATERVNRVVFEYEDRAANDRHVLFDSGAGQHLITKRLKSVSTYIDGVNIGYRNSSFDNRYPGRYTPSAPAATAAR